MNAAPRVGQAQSMLAAGREIPEVSGYVAFRSGRRDAFPSADLSIDG